MLQFTAPQQRNSAPKAMFVGQPLVFETQYKFDQNTLIPKCEALAKSVPKFKNFHYDLEVGDAGSTAMAKDKGPHTWSELKDFCDFASRQASMILQGWRVRHKGIIITNSWVNRHGTGGWTNYHTHPGADLVMAAYIKADPLSGDLIIMDPLEYAWCSYPAEDDGMGGRSTKFAARSNTVYFFAPFLRHATEESKSKEDRWVLSMNFKAIMDYHNVQNLLKEENIHASANGN